MRTGGRAAIAAAIFGIGCWLACVETSAQSAPKDVAARVEIYPIPSLTISDQQFLTGDANGKPVIVGGEFRIDRGFDAEGAAASTGPGSGPACRPSGLCP